MLLSVERPFAGASAFVIPGATLRHRNGLVNAVPPASTEHVRTDNGGSPGTCEILWPPQRAPGRETGSTTPGLGGAPVRRGAKTTSGRGGTAERRQRSAAGRAAGSHSALIVPTKLANGPPPEPGEGSEASDHGSLLRNTTNASKFDHRVHETGADSDVGETIAADGVHFAGLPDGPGLAEGSVPALPSGRFRGRGRGDRGGV